MRMNYLAQPSSKHLLSINNRQNLRQHLLGDAEPFLGPFLSRLGIRTGPGIPQVLPRLPVEPQRRNVGHRTDHRTGLRPKAGWGV